MKILLAVDGSPFTMRAVEHLLQHMAWFREPPELHLLHVHLPIPSARARAVVGAEILEGYYREESEAALDVAAQPLRAAGKKFVSSYRVGEVGVEMAKYVAEHDITLVVMGTHGHGDLKKLFMGSTATKIVAAVSVPVMLVK